MIRYRHLLVAAVAIVAATSPLGAQDAPQSSDIVGIWRASEGGGALLRFAPCQGNKVCGTIHRTNPNVPANARDMRNPDPQLRNRPLVGVTTFGPLQRRGDDWHGPGYNPEDGRRFTATLRPTGDRMTVRGCVAVFCRTVQFVRAR